MLRILILVLIFDNFTHGIPTPDRTQTRVCSKNRCCTTESTSKIIESSATEQEIAPGRCALPATVDPEGIYLLLSCSRHQTIKFPNSESPIFCLLA